MDYDGSQQYPIYTAEASRYDGLLQQDGGNVDPFSGDNNGDPGFDFSSLLGGEADGSGGLGDITGAGDSGDTGDGGGIDPIVLNLQRGTVSTVSRIASGVQFRPTANSHPDGTGGSRLDFASGSIDLLGIAPGALAASNFHIG